MPRAESMRTAVFYRAIALALPTATMSCHALNEASEARNCGDISQDEAIFRSSLRDGFTPSPIVWADRSWRVNAGSNRHRGMDHSVRISPDGTRIRFELRDTLRDNAKSDSRRVRRAELSGSLYGNPTRLPNGESLWGAFSFNHHHWSDYAGMAELQGGVYGQIHIGSAFGGSPALAFRRTKQGRFRITTRGQYDREGSVRYGGDLSFNEAHDLVYRVTVHPRRGSLSVWIDGEQVVDESAISIGHENAESYWNLGIYFARGISNPIIADYANHVYPGPESLEERVARPLCWSRLPSPVHSDE
jgi:hypothetical protein